MGVFTYFFSCTNDTKSRKASNMKDTSNNNNLNPLTTAKSKLMKYFIQWNISDTTSKTIQLSTRKPSHCVIKENIPIWTNRSPELKQNYYNFLIWC